LDGPSSLIGISANTAIRCPEARLIADENKDRIRTFRIASSPVRIKIMSLLNREPSSVGKVTKALGISRQLANHHLRILMEIGLITESGIGTIKIYSITPKGAELLKELGTPSEERPKDQGKPRDRILRWAPVAAACSVFILSAIRYLLETGAPSTWLLGGAIGGILTYLVLKWALSRLAPVDDGGGRDFGD